MPTKIITEASKKVFFRPSNQLVTAFYLILISQPIRQYRHMIMKAELILKWINTWGKIMYESQKYYTSIYPLIADGPYLKLWVS